MIRQEVDVDRNPTKCHDSLLMPRKYRRDEEAPGTRGVPPFFLSDIVGQDWFPGVSTQRKETAGKNTATILGKNREMIEKQKAELFGTLDGLLTTFRPSALGKTGAEVKPKKKTIVEAKDKSSDLPTVFLLESPENGKPIVSFMARSQGRNLRGISFERQENGEYLVLLANRAGEFNRANFKDFSVRHREGLVVAADKISSELTAEDAQEKFEVSEIE